MIAARKGKTQHPCHFATVKSPRDIFSILHDIFGLESTESRWQLPYNLPPAKKHLYWKQHDLDVAMMETSEGTYLFHITTWKRSPLRWLKAIRKEFEVDSRKIFRESYYKHTKKEYLDEIDNKIRFRLTAVGVFATFWLIIGLPNEVRFELLLLITIITLIFEYGKMERAVDIRLILFGSSWYFIYAGIPAGLVYSGAMIIAWFSSSSLDLIEYTFFTSPILLIMLIATLCVAMQRGNHVRRKINGLQDYLSTNRLPSSLTSGLQLVKNDCQFLLLFLAILSGYFYAFRFLLIFDEFYSVIALVFILLFSPFLLLSLRHVYRSMKGEHFRQQLFPMMDNLQHFHETIKKIAEDDRERRKFN